MNTYYSIILLGLLLEIIGVGILLKDELSGFATFIKISKDVDARMFQKPAIWLAKIFGSTDVTNTDPGLVDKFSRRLYGFLLIFLGFVFQALAVIYIW